ncbi:broad-complex core protein isoforms 1/2/3/4/5 isoform X2 [Folsomia candida]|uniref:broad-complex core protein isoforms 1/2/3/4/5 isoform X2 n=1 Tax=Folsomia candida TaxID=158441 RepID=UPI000B90672E|nr:broad-complex core protein isoforms 1/2/3/4/5 isoform X2 [Folsomia candida]
MFLSHGGRPTKGNGRKRKGVDEYAAENRVDFTSRSIIRDGQLVRILVCRFCCQSIGARSDRIKEHLASKRHQKLKLEAFREAAEAGRDLSQEYSDDSVSGLLPEPPITMLKFPGKALAHLLDGGSGGGTTPDGRREMTPEADNMDRKPVMPTPPPLKEHLMSSPPPQHHPPGHMPQLSGSGGRGGIHNHLGTPPPPVSSSSSQHHQNHHNHHPSSLGGGGGGGGSNGGGRSSTPINNHSHSSASSASPPQQLLCVRWGNFDSNIVSMFTKLRTAEHFVDATLWCEGKTIKCHKMILSACSTYFEKLLTENPNPHPIIFLKDMRFWEITALVEFMYKGEVSIHQEKLQSLLRAAESLQIKGLGSPSANDGPGGIGNATEPMDRSRHHSGVDADDSMDMSTTTATPNNNSSLATSHLQSNPFSNQILNSFSTSRGSPSLLHMNMGMDLSSRSSTGDHPSPLSLSLSSNNNNNNNTSNPAKRRKKENPRRLDILPTRTSMPIPVFNSTIMSMPVDHHHQHHHNDDEYDAEPPSDDEMTIHENDGPPHPQQQQQQRPHIIENFKQEPDSLLQHHQHIGKLGGLPQHQHPSSYEEDEDEGDGQENYGDHHQDGGVGAGGLQMDETKSDSEGEADGEEPSPEDEENSTIDHQQIQSQQGYDEETDESGALSLRVASAAERERLEREQRSRKGNPIKKILVGNINNNNNNNNNESGSIFHSPTSAAE